MIARINMVEAASELASRKVVECFQSYSPWVDKNDESKGYTEEATEAFIEAYEDFWDTLDRCIVKDDF